MPTPQAIIGMLGDSRIAENMSTMPQHGCPSAGQSYEFVGTTPSWIDEVTPGDTNWFSDVGLQYFAGQGLTWGAIPGGDSGTNLLSHWDPGVSDSSWTKFTTKYATAGSPSLAYGICLLGPNSIQTTSSWTKADIITAYQNLGDAFHALNGAPLLYLDIMSEKDAVGAGFSGGFSDPAYILQMNTYRQAVLDVVNTHSLRMGPNLTGQVYADHTHFDSTTLATIVGKLSYLAQASSTRGPQVSSLTIDSTKKILRLTPNQDLGNSVSSSVGGFRFFDGASDVTGNLSSAVVTSARLITFTLSVAIAGTPTVSFASGSDAVGATMPTSTAQTPPSGATLTIPMEPFFGHAVTNFVPPGVKAGVFAGVAR